MVFWFQAAFVSDQKEQTQILPPLAMDLHYGAMEVRHAETLLDSRSRLAEQPAQVLPPVRSLSLQAGYRLARDQISA